MWDLKVGESHPVQNEHFSEDGDLLDHTLIPLELSHITLPAGVMAAPLRKVPLIHRDISWLQFNERVLAEAWAEENPLFERVKFLSIATSNLDEFFMIRVSSVLRSLTAYMRQKNEQKVRHLTRIKDAIFRNIESFARKQYDVFEQLRGACTQNKIHLTWRAEKESQAFRLGQEVFQTEVQPVLKKLEPFQGSRLTELRSLEVAVLFQDQGVVVPKTLPATFVKEEHGVFYIFFLDDLLVTHLPRSLKIETAPTLVRLTRDGDFTIELDDEDPASIPDRVRTGLSVRDKGRPVRVQMMGETAMPRIEMVAQALKLETSQVLVQAHPLYLQGLWSAINKINIENKAASSFCYAPLQSYMPTALHDDNKLFDALKHRDILLHHPYDTFEAFVRWVQVSCEDPQVTCIELTIYRTQAMSSLIEALKRAARHKTVRAVIELRARFDELNNLKLAEELRDAGVQVAFGFGNLKIHAKVTLVTRQEGGVETRYTHLSTGNYHPGTAKQYTDLAIITAHPDIGTDARSFFDSIWREEVPTNFKQLLSAPAKLHRRLLQLIEQEIKAAQEGKSARIFAKVNALVDDAVIKTLYRASQAGVKVDLVVRGACSLVPGVKGLSENIRVISLVDRFLEHSRIYYFESSKAMYLSSADWMPRNFFSRIEVAYPVLDPQIYQYLVDVVFPTYLLDNVKAYELTSQGMWKRRQKETGASPLRAQFYFSELAVQQYKNTFVAY